ncbi:MAG: hypothetical protein J6A85_06220 [Clostridia bacterium]|nr:hypothetical protein [Clostridia bacterium]
MKTKKRRGIIFLVLSAAVPVAGILLFFAAFILHGACTEWLDNLLLEQILPVLNPDAPRRVFVWIDEIIRYFMYTSICAFPVLLYSAIVRFVTPKAEEVYLTPKLSLWTNLTSAACGVTVASAVLLVLEMLSEDDVSRYPNRIRALSVFLPIVFVAFLVLVFVYIFSWNGKRDPAGNALPVRVIFLDILRGIFTLPGYALLAAIGYNILLILFSDAF